MLQTDNYSLVMLVQLLLLTYDLLVNSFSELLRTTPVAQLVLYIIQDIGLLFNLMIVLLMLFNTYVFQNLRWVDKSNFVWSDGLQALFFFQRMVAVLYYYLYKRAAEHLADPRLYEDSLWLRDEFRDRKSQDGRSRGHRGELSP
ncbi:transmembrane protein 138-like isoform X2 [Conger conger]|uniref:transmembrane protein 138-like isoform X2 n=1 Tax=Conger conger TaxID=82655 RepID=UPI002A5AD3C9|nr:transmembrane protein 138-like isoform X2 [Conger conger]